MKNPQARLTLLAAFAMLLPSIAAAQGPLAPPGAPAPTMKTLDQIESRTPIFSAGGPINISSPGSYYLIADSTFVGNGIVIESDNVTIDLNGFSLNGFGIGTGRGIVIIGLHKDIVIRNGTVRNFGNRGIDFFNGTSCRLEDIHVADNKATGALVNDNTIVLRCTFRENSGYGVEARRSCLIKDSTALRNGSDGIWAFTNSIVENCTATNNNAAGAFGIRAGNQSLVFRCTASANFGVGGGGISVEGGSVARQSLATSNDGGVGIRGGDVIDCVASNNGSDGILAAGSQIIGNTVENNGNASVAGLGHGIRVEGINSRVEGNTAVFNEGHGIAVVTPAATNNLIIKNTGRANSAANYSIVPGNRIAPIVAVASNGVLVTEANGGATGFNTDHPWANFSY